MRSARFICLVTFAMAPLIVRADDLLDRAAESLSFSGFDDQVRARLSGLIDFEFYHFTHEAPGLIFTDDHSLLSPRFTLFFDAQLGSNVYVFAQGRVDRGFDPGDGDLGIRLDEYAVRWTPWQDGRFSLQAGRFGTVAGNYVARHLSWENPFVNAPLIYENVTGIYDAEAPSSAGEFAEGLVEDKYDYNPVVWGPSYATGLAVSGKIGSFDYAAEIKNAALSSRPESWDATDDGFRHPSISTRIGYRPDIAWNLGVSASEGAYFTGAAAHELPHGTGIDDFKQKVLAQDVSFAWRHWQLWAEMYEARFEVPRVGNADVLGWYVEAKYKFSPRFFGALRLNQMLFDNVPDGEGARQPWGHDLWRIDTAATFRLTPHAQVKLQYSLQHEARVNDAVSHMIATQFTVKF